MDDPFLGPSVTGAVWRYRTLVVLVAVLGAVAGAAFSFGTSSERYRATSSMVLEDPRSSILFDVGARQRQVDYLADQIEILRSGAIAARTAAIASTTGGIDTTALEVLETTEILAVADSALVTVRSETNSPEKSVAIASGFIDAYQAFLREQTESAYASSIQVLEDTIAQLETEAELLRTEIEDLTTRNDPNLALLIQQATDSAPRLLSLLDSLVASGSADRDQLRSQINDILLQFQAVNAATDLSINSPALQERLSEQDRIALRINDLAERRDRIRLDSQLLSSGVAAAIPALAADEVGRDFYRPPAIGLALGLVLGITAAYGLALRRRDFTDRNQPEQILDAPLVAEVPTFRQEGLKTELPVKASPRSASAESFRFAAAALAVGGHKRIVVVSASLGDGKTVVAANTALAAAREGSRVLLVDADFGNQMATALLAPGIRPERGITEVVEEGAPLASAIIELEGTAQGGLHLLPRGWRKTTAPEFFRLPATRSFFERADDFYDLVIIDAPPLLHVAYASTLAGVSDGVLVVVPHRSRMSTLGEIRDRLDLIGATAIGYVYNLAPLRLELTRTEGSMKDVLGFREQQEA